MMAQMDDQRAADGVEHLQSAARELLAAARSFLDVVEEVVDDRDRLSGAAASVVDLVRDGVATVTAASSPLQPWETPAWGATEWDAPAEQDAAAEQDPDASAEHDAAAEQDPAAGRAQADSDDEAAPDLTDMAEVADITEGGATRKAAPRRVKRIAVD